MNLAAFDLKVLQAIIDNPQATRQELMERFGISESAAYRAVRKLKAEGIIARVGSKRYGRWEIHSAR